jgi:hypothetical protein
VDVDSLFLFQEQMLCHPFGEFIPSHLIYSFRPKNILRIYLDAYMYLDVFYFNDMYNDAILVVPGKIKIKWSKEKFENRKKVHKGENPRRSNLLILIFN